ncbi:MAG: DsbA family oxidoreductase [Hyphomicrobiales bacterium]|nr:DsbA family oxidoreductase [Hyphomicrobiales bacterium]HRA94679.1 DsbA family oxidoreductase [Aestuariivirga sp.]
MKAISIDVISDVICPWCFLGKRRLDKAIALLAGVKIEVNWRPFFLDPTIPAEGMSRRTYLENKFGTERLKTIHDPLIAAGKADGVPYAFDKITRTPNTMDAHRLIRWSHASGKQHNVSERLFMAYFNGGLDIGDRTMLAKIAGEAGMDGSDVSTKLDSDADVAAVNAEVEHAYRMGVTGVPCFIFAQKQGLMGAQPAEVLAEAINRFAA